jgi:hypothetical protein
LTALSRPERPARAEIAHELIASFETTNEYDEARYAELKSAVQVGVDQVDLASAARTDIVFALERSLEDFGEAVQDGHRVLTLRRRLRSVATRRCRAPSIAPTSRAASVLCI